MKKWYACGYWFIVDFCNFVEREAVAGSFLLATAGGAYTCLTVVAMTQLAS